MNKAIQTSIGPEPFKLLFQFLLITVVGGAIFALVNVRKEEDARREARARAIQTLQGQLREAYRAIKQARRRLRSRLIRIPQPESVERSVFETCMDDLLKAQLSLEEVEDNIEMASSLFGEADFQRISAAIHYATRYFHDVFEDYEKGRVKRTDSGYVIGCECKSLRDFLLGTDCSLFEPVSESYALYKERTRPLDKRHATLLKIDELRRETCGRLRFRKIAFECVRVVFLELQAASQSKPALA